MEQTPALIMDAQAFTYWLHGWSEINGGGAPTPVQWQIINDHLDLVFNKVTPDRQLHVTGRAPTYCVTTYTGHPPVVDVTGKLDMSWYPESLREYNRLHPENPRFC